MADDHPHTQRRLDQRVATVEAALTELSEISWPTEVLPPGAATKQEHLDGQIVSGGHPHAVVVSTMSVSTRLGPTATTPRTRVSILGPRWGSGRRSESVSYRRRSWSRRGSVLSGQAPGRPPLAPARSALPASPSSSLGGCGTAIQSDSDGVKPLFRVHGAVSATPGAPHATTAKRNARGLRWPLY